MSVRYKFKNTTQYDTINFAGNSISLDDFKREVIKQKRLTTDDDLKVVVAETKREFTNLDDQIPKNTSVVISRVPRTPKSKKLPKRVLTPKTTNASVEKSQPNDGLAKTIMDLSKLNISEEKKIEVMMQQSTSAYSPSKYSKGSMKVPANYRCNKCHLFGHWIRDCPVVAPSLPKTFAKGKAGIPKSFLNAELQNKENTYPPKQQVERKLSDGVNDLACPICKELFVDAVMISCCGRTFCDNCIREKLLESASNECPECHEADVDLDSLIPNRYMRKAVSTFKSGRKLPESSSKVKI